MLHFVHAIAKIEPFALSLVFDNGEVKSVDLSRKLHEWSQSPGSRFAQLLQPDYFATVKLNSELQTIFWDNGIDFCPDTLYNWADEK